MTEAGPPDAPPTPEGPGGENGPPAGAATAAPSTADAAAEAGTGEPVPGEAPSEHSSVPLDDVVAELAAARAERDEYLELARAKQAELENFRKQVTKRQTDHLQQAAADLVTKLLPVLDALDNGVGHGDESLVPVRAQ
ncbi:MAG: nucleotide exchange factor GrpE, partial [Actinomycetota bacterium]|nr:nucleotide exchange factor GrpE [Actinomycetota bacterium]